MASSRAVAVGFLIFVSIYFLFAAGAGLRAGINFDDVNNLNVYAFQPAGEIVASNVFYFTPAYRPAGALFYRPLFALFGLRPLPYRIVCFFLLIANLWVQCLAIRSLTGSMETAAVVTLICVFHPAFRDLYTSSGTIYDLLCYAFYFGAWLCYLHARRAGQSGPVKRIWLFALVAILYICALDAKEMAATFPVLLVLTELATVGELNIRALFLRCRVAIVLGLATIPYIHAKFSPASFLYHLSTYRYEIGLHSFLQNYGLYLDALFYRDGVVRPHWFGAPQAASMLGLMLGLALLLRSKQLLFSWSMMIVSFLPIAFIAPRAAYVFYIPFTFLSLYVGVLVITLRGLILAKPRGFGDIDLRRAVLPILVFVLLFRAHRIEGQRLGEATELGWPLVASIVNGLDREHASVPRGATVLAVNDPFPKGQFGLILLLRLYFRDPALEVDHAEQDDCRHSQVLEFCGESITMVRRQAEGCQAVRCKPARSVPMAPMAPTKKRGRPVPEPGRPRMAG